MLICEVMAEDSLVAWLVSGVRTAVEKGISAAEATWDSTGNKRLAKMHGGGALGKWFAANAMPGRGRDSVYDVVVALKQKELMPIIQSITGKREEAGFSYSKALQNLIGGLLKPMVVRGYKREAAMLNDALVKFNNAMDAIGNGDNEEDDDIKVAREPVEDPNKQAHAIINSVIKELPKELQGDARTYVTRRGFTLQALQQWMTANNITK